MAILRSLATQLALCLFSLFFLSSFKRVSAAPTGVESLGNDYHSSSPLVERADKGKGKLDSITPTNDGGTSDKSPGIGIEFEANNLIFANKNCPLNDAYKSKAKEIKGRKDEKDHWALTVDTTSTSEGNVNLSGEYILNGKKIKLGTGDAGKAAQDVSKDLEKFAPWTGKKPNTVELLDPVNDKCKTWEISKPSHEQDWKNLIWQWQITAPMPLAAIDELFRQMKGVSVNPLLPFAKRSKDKMVWVNKAFFESDPQGNKQEDVSEEVRGFFSMIMTYVKENGKQVGAHQQSPKGMSSIMPRTDFATMYQSVKDKIKGKDLYELVKILSCYTNEEDEYADIDDGYCSGCLNDPKPNHDIDSKMEFKIKGQNPWTSKDETVSFTVKDWMEGLQGTSNKKVKEANELLKKHGKKDRKDDEPIDLLSFYDRWIDGQIGGLGSVQEHVYENNKKMAPLFEFRDISGTTHDKFKQEVEKAEKAIIQLHKNHGEEKSKDHGKPGSHGRSG